MSMSAKVQCSIPPLGGSKPQYLSEVEYDSFKDRHSKVNITCNIKSFNTLPQICPLENIQQ